MMDPLSVSTFSTVSDALRSAIRMPPQVVARLPGGGFVVYSPWHPLKDAEADFLVLTPFVWVPLSDQGELELAHRLRELTPGTPEDHSSNATIPVRRYPAAPVAAAPCAMPEKAHATEWQSGLLEILKCRETELHIE